MLSLEAPQRQRPKTANPVAAKQPFPRLSRLPLVSETHLTEYQAPLQLPQTLPYRKVDIAQIPIFSPESQATNASMKTPPFLYQQRVPAATRAQRDLPTVFPPVIQGRRQRRNDEARMPEPVPTENTSSLPTRLRADIEALSSLPLNDVRVHYNSPRPAQVQALAYTQGTEIYVRPGQERHLAHEVWHVVQQKQGRVKPTMRLGGAAINDDAALEAEADRMGAQPGRTPRERVTRHPMEMQVSMPSPVIQRKVGFEFETAVRIATAPSPPETAYQIPYGVQVFESKDKGWQIKADSSNVEFVTKEVDDNDSGRMRLIGVMHEITAWAHAMCSLTQTANPQGSGRIADVMPALGTARQCKMKGVDRDVVLYTKPRAADQVTAAPQATGGITLDTIPRLIDKLVTTKMEHLRRSKTFKPSHLPPQQPPLTGDQENDAFNLQLHNQMLDTHNQQMSEFQDQGYATQDISYSVGAETLFLLSFLTTAKSKVTKWLDTIDAFKDNDKEEFEREISIPVGEFRKQSGKLQGLLTLVISYLFGGDASAKAIPYTKAIASLMSRTNIYELYRLLSADEKKLFIPDLILHISGLGDGPLFKGGFESKQGVQKGPSRSEWIESIIHGTPVPVDVNALAIEPPEILPYDRLSQGSKTPEALNSGSLGAFKTPDYNPRSKKADLAVLEIRNIPKNQGIDDWMETALLIFELFRELNESPEERQARLEREAFKEKRLKEDASKASSMPNVYQY